LKLLEVFPNIGQIKVFSENLEQFYAPKAGDDDANHTILRGNLELGKSFKEDPRILAASPDFFISSESFGPLPTVSNHVDLSANSGETSDWGIDDIRAPSLWADPLAQDGILVGALDTGFLRHDDLVFTDVPARLAVDDHGNHVIGIMCASHNGKGTRGVLPNCFGAPRSADVFPIADSQGNVQRFMIRFSQIISALNLFVDDRSESIKMFNISMGYNWMSNFGINPDDAQNELYRGNAAQHGEMLLSTLAKASTRGAFIVSAAGNDSTGLLTPINAKYASPFNWAAITTRERGIDTNALVIEAHAKPVANADVGSRASFSNVGGDLSCPGVNILSTVARDSFGQESSAAYGTMSGTSMAAPYCASGAQLFALVRPGYEIDEVVECLINSAASSATGAGQLRLDAAATTCPRR